MKKLILVLTAIFAMTSIASAAQTTEKLTVKAGQQKTAKKSKLKIKIVSVEDSRCPVGATCVWAGNAKVTIQVIGKQSSKNFDLNSSVGPKGDQIDGWAIYLDSITPIPQSGRTVNSKAYTATFTITRLQR